MRKGKTAQIAAILFLILALTGIGVFWYGRTLNEMYVEQGSTRGIYNLEENSFSGSFAWSSSNIGSSAPSLSGLKEIAQKRKNTFMYGGLISAGICFLISLSCFRKSRNMD